MTDKKHSSNDIFLHEISNLSTALTFVADELATINHSDPTIIELVDGLTILTGRLHRTIKGQIISQTVPKSWPEKKPRKKQKRLQS